MCHCLCYRHIFSLSFSKYSGMNILGILEEAMKLGSNSSVKLQILTQKFTLQYKESDLRENIAHTQLSPFLFFFFYKPCKGKTKGNFVVYCNFTSELSR